MKHKKTRAEILEYYRKYNRRRNRAAGKPERMKPLSKKEFAKYLRECA